MFTSRTRRSWLKPALAALLLVLQMAGAPAVGVAHAREPGPAQASLESGHSDRCPVLHNELTCILCQYAGSLVVTRPAQPEPDLGRVAFVPVLVVSRPRAAERPAPSTSPRAPPAQLL
ncbi:MAG TPA: hypothetical protein VH113_04035 [Gemmatimonadales bacterium]|jgi:hypothetical protein|nr:hypothetical protein [Gemmatimonadales bacterium]